MKIVKRAGADAAPVVDRHGSSLCAGCRLRDGTAVLYVLFNDSGPWVTLLHLPALQRPQILKQMRQRRHKLPPVAFVQTLIRRVGVAFRVFNTKQQGWCAAEEVGQRTDEPNGSTAADRDGL